ncbi:MAG: prephenate dehydrogenase/arogenate dehydrogenase family protein [Natronospirillum sp.]
MFLPETDQASADHRLTVRRLGIIGLGLIGASLAAGLRQRGADLTIVGYDCCADTRTEALSCGYIDAVAESPLILCEQVDLLVLATPVLSLPALLAELKPALMNGTTLLTDVGSVKKIVAQAALDLFGEQPPWLVPGHPIAGSEFSGIKAANPALYVNHQVILTPHERTDAFALAQVSALWESVGAKVQLMSVARHDEVLAATSHLPHLLAFALVDSLAQESESYEIFHYAAGGFRDFTRIAASDPTMWHDIFLTNDVATLKVLDHYLAELTEVRNSLAAGNGEQLFSMFTRAKKARDYFSTVLAERNL